MKLNFKAKINAFRSLQGQVRFASLVSMMFSLCGIIILLGSYFETSLSMMELSFLTFIFDIQCRYILTRILMFIKKEYSNQFHYFFTICSILVFTFFIMECYCLVHIHFLIPKESAIIKISLYNFYATTNFLIHTFATVVILETLVSTTSVKHNKVKQTIKIEFHENTFSYN